MSGNVSKRLDVQFSSQGVNCKAWLYLPDTANPPVIVMAHGLGAVRRMRLDVFAERLCQAGYACLVFDYRHFGDSDGQPRQILDIGRQHQDWQAAVAFARGRPDVDGSQVILWGTSFSGGHVLHVGARDAGLAAVVAQCPFTDGIASTLALGPVSGIKVSALALLDNLGRLIGARPVMVPLTGRPGSAALMTAPDAQPGYEALKPSGAPISNEVAARFGLQITWYHPGRDARRIQCPTLLCVCEQDSVAPAKPTLRYAKAIRQGVVKTYKAGHFDIYVGADAEHVLRDQIAFLRQHVPIDAASRPSRHAR